MRRVVYQLISVVLIRLGMLASNCRRLLLRHSRSLRPVSITGFNTAANGGLKTRTFSSSTDETDDRETSLSTPAFHAVSDATLEYFMECLTEFEEVSDEFEMDLADGVLKLDFGGEGHGTWVRCAFSFSLLLLQCHQHRFFVFGQCKSPISSVFGGLNQ